MEPHSYELPLITMTWPTRYRFRETALTAALAAGDGSPLRPHARNPAQ